MQKVLIWDHTGNSSKWVENYLETKDIEIIRTITPKESAPEILLRTDSWDWLLIFEWKMRPIFDAIIQIMHLPPEKIIYAFDGSSWLQHPKAITNLLNTSNGVQIRRQLLISDLRKLNAFLTCTVEGVSYINPSADSMLVPHMFVTGTNWASRDMKRFHELSKQYYGVDDSSGYFLDLGANIGTTGIYFLKKLTPNLKLLAFEPDPENFKMYRVNAILNDVEETTELVNCGLGKEASELMLYRNGLNSGANSFIKSAGSTPIATIKIISLDSYLAENNIAASEVKYLWIDTEGFEDKVLLGAKNLLRENPAPIFMECNLKAWDNSGCFEDMMALLAESYSHFIHFWRGETLHPLEDLRTLERPDNTLGQIGDIFLIRKGAID